MAGYIFSTLRSSAGNKVSRWPGYARKEIEDQAEYQFYTGAGPKFAPSNEDTACLVENVPGQVSIAWNPYLGKYVMASSSDFHHPKEIIFLVADAPYGLWSRPIARIKVPEYRQGKRGELMYCAYFHPELFRENGRVMNLTYSLILQNAGFDANCEIVEAELKRRKQKLPMN